MKEKKVYTFISKLNRLHLKDVYEKEIIVRFLFYSIETIFIQTHCPARKDRKRNQKEIINRI